MLCVGMLAMAPAGAAHVDVLTFHHDPQRTGWISTESKLTPSNVSSESFGLIWQSEQLDRIAGAPPHIYASPLYVDQVTLTEGQYRDRTVSAVFVATNAGIAYAVSAFRQGGVPAGAVLWKSQLDPPCLVGYDGIPTGVLSTPVIDPVTHRLYLTSCTTRPTRGSSHTSDWGNQIYKAYALDISSGKVLPGWPVSLDRRILNSPGINQNPPGPAFEPSQEAKDAGTLNRPLANETDFNLGTQRGALNLSPDGSLLYATFGESIPGWLVAIGTRQPGVVSAFASVAVPHGHDGGIWGAGGPAVDGQGNVYVVVGTGFNGYADQAHDWVQSALKLSAPRSRGFRLLGTYTPFNYCQTARLDIDIGSGGALLLPPLEQANTTTPELMAFGGKQGNLYLVNRAHMPGRLDRRPPCGVDSQSDKSLLSPVPQPQFGKPGPLNVFGPYSDRNNAMDQAKSRTVPAYYRADNGAAFLFASGSSKRDENSDINVPPCLARIRVATLPGRAAYLAVDRVDETDVFENPGSPVITSNGSKNPIVWVLDEATHRSRHLSEPNAAHPKLYAFDAMTLRLIWKSQPEELFSGGKYSEPAIARGTVFVGTDRVQAFGLRSIKR